MSINFNQGTTPGETFTEGGKTWTWDGEKWNLNNSFGPGGGGGVINGDDFVEIVGDTMTGDLLLKDDNGDTSPITPSSDEATAVHKKYVDDKINQIDLEVDIDHGAWAYEVPDVVDHVGTATLVIPSYIQQITPYTFEVQWEGGINESEVVIEWTAKRGGTDVSGDVFTTHVTRSYVGAAKVTATFTEEGEHEISCKITSDLSSEVVETSTSIVDVQFYDGIAKIGDIIISPKNNLIMGQMATYAPTNNGDADDVEYEFEATLKTPAQRVNVFDRKRCMDAFEKGIKGTIPDSDYAIQVESVLNALDRWEALIKYDDDLYWSLWYSSRKAPYDPNKPADDDYNLPWNGLYFDVSASSDQNSYTLATGGAGSDHDNSVNPAYEGVPGLPRSIRMWLNTHWANSDLTGESEQDYRFSYGKLWVHEIGHGLGLVNLPRGWYKFLSEDYPDEYYDLDKGFVYHESKFPRTVQAYREITGNNSFDRIHGKAPSEGHWPWMAQTFDGVTYPGWLGIMSTGPKIDKVCVGLLVDHGWVEVNPGTSEEDNPQIVNTFTSVADVETEDRYLRHVLSHYEDSQYYTPHHHEEAQFALGDTRWGGGVDIYEPANEDYWGSGVKDFTNPIESVNANEYSITIKTPSTWTIKTTGTSDTANDGPVIKSIDQVALSSDTRAIDLFVTPYDDTFVAKPNPGTYHLFDENGNVTGDYGLSKTIRISDTDLSGFEHTWGKISQNLEVDIKNLTDGDYLAGQITTIESDPSDDYIQLKVDLLDYKGFTVDGDEAEIKFVEGNNLFVKVAGDTMEGPLEMKPDTGKAKIIINGSSDTINDSSSVLEFRNQSVAGSDKYGVLEFHSDSNSQYFKFDENVDIGSNGLHSVGRVRFIADGTIQVNKTDKILFRNPANGNEGNASVEIQRAPNTRRTFAIRGKKPDDTEGDILSVYANNDGQGGDAINYVGKMVGGSNLINKDYVDYRYGPSRLNVIQHNSRWKSGTDPFSDSNFCTIDVDGNSTQYRDSIRGIVVYEGFGEGTTPGGVGGRSTRNLWRTGAYVEIVNPNNGGLWLSGKITNFSRNNGRVTIKFDRIWNEPFDFTQNQECNVFITGI
jgi:hypothetical protein